MCNCNSEPISKTNNDTPQVSDRSQLQGSIHRGFPKIFRGSATGLLKNTVNFQMTASLALSTGNASWQWDSLTKHRDAKDVQYTSVKSIFPSQQYHKGKKLRS